MVHLAGEASKLVVFADSEIRAVPLHHCDAPAAATCASCVGLQDPHCAWDATKNLCVAVSTKLHDSDADKTLFQDIVNGRHKGCGYEPGNSRLRKLDLIGLKRFEARLPAIIMKRYRPRVSADTI